MTDYPGGVTIKKIDGHLHVETRNPTTQEPVEWNMPLPLSPDGVRNMIAQEKHHLAMSANILEALEDHLETLSDIDENERVLRAYATEFPLDIFEVAAALANAGLKIEPMVP